MNKLQLVKSENFGEVQCDIYRDGNEMFMTITQLAECLQYSEKRGVEKLIENNDYLKSVEFSCIAKVPHAKGGTQNTRIFADTVNI
jgi:prophage antirepressor-like protein